MPADSLVFVETSGHVDAALKLVPRPEFLALSPQAAFHLDQLKINYLALEDFCPEAELAAIRDEILFAQVRWIDAADAWLRERVPLFENLGFFPVQTHAMYLKLFFDEIQMRARQLDAIAKKRGKTKIYFVPAAGREQISADLFFRDSLISRMLPAWAAKHRLKLAGVPGAQPAWFPDPVRPISLRLKRLLQARWKSVVVRLFSRPAAGGAKILLKPDYDCAGLVGPLMARKAAVESWGGWMARLAASSPQTDEADGLRSLSGLKSEFFKSTLFSEPITVNGFSYESAAGSRLNYLWDVLLPEAWSSFIRARSRLQRDQIRAVVLPMTENHRDVGVLQAARALGIPTVIHQHGGFSGTCEYPGWEINDFRDADHILMYGPGVEEYYRSRLARHSAAKVQLYMVGSARMDRLAHQRLPSRSEGSVPPTVLYFTDTFKGYTRYLCGESLPDVGYYRTQRKFLELAARYPQYRFIYKTLPGRYPNPLAATAAEICPEIRVCEWGPLTDLINEADFIIADMPSTGMLEAMLTNKSLLVLAQRDSVLLTPRAEAAIRKRAILTLDEETFLSEAGRILKSGNFRSGIETNREYVRDFGTLADDGRSAERAADLIIRCVQRLNGS